MKMMVFFCYFSGLIVFVLSLNLNTYIWQKFLQPIKSGRCLQKR